MSDPFVAPFVLVARDAIIGYLTEGPMSVGAMSLRWRQASPVPECPERTYFVREAFAAALGMLMDTGDVAKSGIRYSLRR